MKTNRSKTSNKTTKITSPVWGLASIESPSYEFWTKVCKRKYLVVSNWLLCVRYKGTKCSSQQFSFKHLKMFARGKILHCMKRAWNKTRIPSRWIRRKKLTKLATLHSFLFTESPPLPHCGKLPAITLVDFFQTAYKMTSRWCAVARAVSTKKHLSTTDMLLSACFFLLLICYSLIQWTLKLYEGVTV